MGVNWTAAQVLELAPDAASAAAGKKLAAPTNWKSLGRSDDAVWGEALGSSVYQVRIAAADLAYKCSCPSRKFPCKHVLGLMLRVAEDASAAPRSDPPEWVTHWLSQRRARADKRETPTDAPPDPKDAESAARAAARRTAQRERRVADGLERLERWLCDLARNGLAGLERQPFSFWDAQAKSLVDAQAPGLAARLRAMGAIPGSSPDWPARLVEHIGRLTLIIHAYRRIDELDEPLRHDLRAMIGWIMNKSDLDAVGQRVADVWLAIGQTIEEEDRLRVQRTWLTGRNTRRMALVLQFAAGGAAFAESIIVGTQWDGELVFHPSACPQRARIAEYRAGVEPIGERPPGHATIEAFLEDVSRQLERLPLLDRFGCVLHDVVPLRVSEGRWLVRDETGRALPLAGADHWTLMALSGGHSLDLSAEWDGDRLRPLAAWAEKRFFGLVNNQT